jgi:site-specific DNA recombinase
VRGYAAKVEHEKIKERTIRGRLARLHAGKPLPSYKVPYGYVWDDAAKTQLAFDPETAPMVRRICEAVLAGPSIRAVVVQLNAEGIPSPTGRLWAMSSAREILHRELYAGRWMALRSQMLRVDGKRVQVRRPSSEHLPLAMDVPPIIDAALFEAVQERLRQNKARTSCNNRDLKATLLRGGFVRCGCGVQKCAPLDHGVKKQPARTRGPARPSHRDE